MGRYLDRTFPCVSACSRLLDLYDQELSSNYWLPYPKDSVGLQLPDISVDGVSRVDGGCQELDGFFGDCFTVDIVTNSLALYVWIEVPGM